MANRDEIVAFCDELLEVEEFSDYGPNGLQVPGAAEVTRVASAVSANLETLQGAIAAGAQLVLAHHGLFWEFHPRALSGPMTERLRTLLDADASLAGYHLPLDAHPEAGNNVLLCEGLGFEPGGRIGEAGGRQVGFVGHSPDAVPIDELLARVKGLIGREPLLQGAGPSEVSSIGIVSGSASSSIHEAAELGLDAFLTGEPAEHAMADAREAGLHFIAAGHYATETLGIRRLGELVAERFGVEHGFIDVPNPV